jgi:hypothetical protein
MDDLPQHRSPGRRAVAGPIAKPERDGRSPCEDRAWLMGLDFHSADPDAEADVNLRLDLGGRPNGKRSEGWT